MKQQLLSLTLFRSEANCLLNYMVQEAQQPWISSATNSSRKVRMCLTSDRSPTDESLELHLKRAYLQAMIWKAADQHDLPDINICDFGWEMVDKWAMYHPQLGGMGSLDQKNWWKSLPAAAAALCHAAEGTVAVPLLGYPAPISASVRLTISVALKTQWRTLVTFVTLWRTMSNVLFSQVSDIHQFS